MKKKKNKNLISSYLKRDINGRFLCRHPEFISGSSRFNSKDKMVKPVYQTPHCDLAGRRQAAEAAVHQHDGERMTFLFHERHFAKAFTLIELLVVVLIIGILAAIALPQYEKAVEKTRASEAFALTKAIADAHQIYYMANGVYADYPDLGLDLPGSPETLAENVHGVKNKYFSCRTRTTSGVQYLALCNRQLGSGNSYSIYVNTNAQWKCSFEGDKAKAICQNLTREKTPGTSSFNF